MSLRRLADDDFEAIREYAKLIGRQAKERHARAVAMRRKWLDDGRPITTTP
jgi:hypothetical protein